MTGSLLGHDGLCHRGMLSALHAFEFRRSHFEQDRRGNVVGHFDCGRDRRYDYYPLFGGEKQEGAWAGSGSAIGSQQAGCEITN
jgi:hypothetical protein